jgi:hypothetical protein
MIGLLLAGLLCAPAAQDQIHLDVSVIEIHRGAAHDLGWCTKDGTTFTTAADPLAVAASVDSLIKLGLAHVLAQPQLQTVAGKSAQVAVASHEGTKGRPFGCSLGVNPQFMADGRFGLALNVEVTRKEQADLYAISGCTETVDVRPGQCALVVETLPVEKADAAKGLPRLAYLPVLGQLTGAAQWGPQDGAVLLVVTPRAEPAPPPARPFRLAFTIQEGQGADARTLAAPTILTREDRPAEFIMGTQALLAQAGAASPPQPRTTVGLVLAAKVTRAREGTAVLELDVQRNQVDGAGAVTDARPIHADRCRTSLEVRLGQRTQVVCQFETPLVVEVTVTPEE